MKMDLPEERLLRLIKGKHKKEDKPVVTHAADNILLKNKKIRAPFLPSLNKALLALLIILCGYFIYSFIFPAGENISSVTGGGDASLPGPDAAIEQGSILPASPDYSVYSEEIKKKELFGPSFIKELKREKDAGVDISKRFSLVGIIAGEKPQAIIEDKEAQKTHYLYKGQSFNGVTVEDIGEGRVVLDHGGEEIILVL
jgi:hypothetical protein